MVRCGLNAFRMSPLQSLKLGRLVGRGEYADAIRLLRASGKPSAMKYLQIADLHRQLGELNQAATAVRQAVDLDARCFEAHRMLADLHYRAGEHAPARTHARVALESYQPPVRRRWLDAAFDRLNRMLLGSDGFKRLSEHMEDASDFDQQWLAWARAYANEGEDAAP
jgi:tetratricopeptide (TPR) repeat protein